MPTVFQAAKLTYAFLSDSEENGVVFKMLMQFGAKAIREAKLQQKKGSGTRDLDDSEPTASSEEWPKELPSVPAS